MAQTRISNEVGASVFAILIGLAAICLGGWLFGPSFSGSTRSQSVNERPAITPLVPENQTDAQTRRDNEVELEATRRAELAATARELRLKRDELAELLAVANKKNEAALSEQKKLRARVSELSKRISEAEEKIGAVPPTSQDRIRELELKLNDLGSERNQLSNSLNNARTENEKLKAELAKLKGGKEKGKAKEKAAPKEQENALRRAVDFPELDLPMLINDPNQLDPEFKPLFVRLREMKDTPDAREKIYAELAKDGKTEPVLQVPFEVGSDTVSNESGISLEGLVEKSGESAKFLVVGYASVDGNPQSNYELSSRRASHVAQKIADGNENTVQAVYFGQTRRFDAEAMPPNRVVEVWRVQ